MRLHVDTDLGSNPDDACALVMLLGLPGVQLTGVTTTDDPGGRRADCAASLLARLGRTDVPVTAGAAGTLTRGAPAGAALDALERAIGAGARIAAIGPLTNLAGLELLRPGALAPADVVVMGGWLDDPLPGFPPWGPERDTNVQTDTTAAEVVVRAAGRLTLVPVSAGLHAPLTGRDLIGLRELGPVGELLARRCEARRDEAGYAELGRAHPGLPDDLVTFSFDPLACAVAAGWDGVRTRTARVSTSVTDGVLRWHADPDGRRVEVAVGTDRSAFTAFWLAAVARAVGS